MDDEVQRNANTDYYAGSSNPAYRIFKKDQERAALTKQHRHLCIVMVGLPGRGKSFIARKLESFMQWKDGGHSVKLFTIGSYRRQATRMRGPAEYFDPDNAAFQEQRKHFAEEALNDMMEFFEKGGEVGIFDATNSTDDRRQWIKQKCQAHSVALVFVESLCDLPHVLEDNYKNKVRHSPDYEGMDEEAAMDDLLRRIANYEKMYETITDESCTYFKLHNLQSKVMCNKVYGSLTKSLLPFLISINITSRPIWICRSGNPVGDAATHDEAHNPTAESRVAPLSLEGQQFAGALSRFLDERCREFYTLVEAMGDRARTLRRSYSVCAPAPEAAGARHPCKLMVSTLPRAIQTVSETSSDYDVELWAQLGPMNKGIFDRMLLRDIKTQDPEWYDRFEADRLKTRFPGGESYADLVTRLEPCVIEAEQQAVPVLICSHITAIQVLFAYFQQIPIEKAVRVPIERHAVYQFTPLLGGMYKLDFFRLAMHGDVPTLEEHPTSTDPVGSPI